MIDSNNTEDFKTACLNSDLTSVRLPGQDQELVDYLVSKNKTALVHILIKNKPVVFSYAYTWDITSPQMVETLIKDGMNTSKAVQVLTAFNRTELVKATVEKYHPLFDTCVGLITQFVVEHGNMELLDYLIEHGLAKNNRQTEEAILHFSEQDNPEVIKTLIAKGFATDTADRGPVYWAVYHNNLPLLRFLVRSGFPVNGMYDEYTHLENAITGNQTEIVTYLLTLKPDITTLHFTKLNGETNALLMAERCKHPEMLEQLKQYLDTKKREPVTMR